MHFKRPTKMKNLVRAFVLTLVATGMYASAQINNAAPVLHGKISAYPVPTCPPDDPNGCGICQLNGCAPSTPAKPK